VDSFGPVSGALQALLPPDNATGNFTKVAQRFAVKIVLSPDQAGLDRLRPGMSVIATVVTSTDAQGRSDAG
jgi:membrane fusion protein (multidrug efflux system)